jgi:hypothetical protein
MAVQEDHDLPNRLLLGPSGENAGSANRPDTLDLAQPVWRSLNDVEHFFAEGANELLRVSGANAPDHPGREVFLDAIGRSWSRCAQKPGFELLTVGAVIDPVPRRRNPFARRDYRRVADHGHEFSMPARLRSQYAEAVLCIVERDALDETRQHFLGR